MTETFRKVFEGVADLKHTYGLFGRHKHAPWNKERISGAIYAGEWWETTEEVYSDFLEVLPPLFFRSDVFGMLEMTTGNVTSVFFRFRSGDGYRYFHGSCDLSSGHPTGPDNMRKHLAEIMLEKA